jgi:hypothetical protein
MAEIKTPYDIFLKHLYARKEEGVVVGWRF